MNISIDGLKSILKIFKKDIIEDIQQNIHSFTIEPTKNDIPMINIVGNLPALKNNVPCVLEYSSSTQSFKANIKIKIQGQSSTMFLKKNFAIELYSDEHFSIPMNKSFKNWGSQYKYVLKANYTDHLHARNIACANMWANIMRGRKDFDSLPEELKTSPNMGAIDGFPIKLYSNGEYKGIYTWNIPKKAWMFNMNKKNPNHAVLQGNANDFGSDEYKINPCNFNFLWNGSSYWTVEEGEESEALTESFNRIISAVINKDIDSLEQYLDIQSAIDYFLFQDAILGIDGLSNNMLCLTYDMQKWYLSAYDMDSTFGLKATGEMDGTPTDVMPTAYLNQNSALLNLLVNSYDSEMKTRYAELRNGALSYSSIIASFEKILNVVNEDERIKDIIPYPDIPNISTNTFDNLKTFIKERLDYLDEKYEVVI
jgi:hypothetical protein